MASVTEAFQRWMAAEQDVHDSNLEMLYRARRQGGLERQVEQAKLVIELREDASRLLREYLDQVEKEVDRLDHPRSQPTALQMLAFSQLPAVEKEPH